ncbi:hypothetical protein N7457_008717 [Penicillium paradoxum]|uniref:uncharacterized protein n=1 Tax=Penicillium paradoxum TaxID=176176 RepID=UPI00254659BE|nr:uncharacterized protein N7457_008717 [Penicillium paradoxum]KAJ5773821.1 hypothetical protein N7457_008717 [Penicillium paradoxum]
MGKSRRESALTKSILSALIRDPDRFKKTALGKFLAFFSVRRMKLVRHEKELFKTLREEVWEFNAHEYQGSFHTTRGQPPLKPMGDLGYSGSTFFETFDGRLLIKSLPRHFEYSFFERDLLEPYLDYMFRHPDSLLVWITDYLLAPYPTLGTLLGLTPAHYIVMENTLCGRDDDPAAQQWEIYDLKPIDYFYPERDLVPQALVGEETLNKLADRFNDKLHLRRADYEVFWRMIQDDTKFLRDANVVDYSLFLVRMPASSQPPICGRQSSWRLGLPSADGKWKYRAAILDFFWARHKLQSQALSGLVQTFNVVGRKGPMTITTTAREYRENFLSMIMEMIEVH